MAKHANVVVAVVTNKNKNFLPHFHCETYRILTTYPGCQHITGIQVTAVNIHETDTDIH